MKIIKFSLHLGITDKLIPYEWRRAWIFNLCNLSGFVIAMIRLLYLFASGNQYSVEVLIVNCLPQLLCITMAVCMYLQGYKTAIAISFIGFPPVLAAMAFATNDRGMEIYLFLYIIFTFFFLHRKLRIISGFVWVLLWFCAVHFTPVSFLPHQPPYPQNNVLNILDYSTGLTLIFLALYTIKFEVWKFETSIRKKKQELLHLNGIKDKIFSVIAHDLRTPVHSSVMLLRLLLQHEVEPVQIKNALPDIISSMEQTGDLLDNLLEWAKSQMQKADLKKMAISPAAITRQTMKFLHDQAARKNISLINEVCAESLALGDENSVKVVLRNLMANAIKFTHPGGVVKVRSAVKGNFVNVCVEDNGIGVAPEKQHLLFSDKYYTTTGTNKETGSGLGLMICEDLARRNGGTLSFDDAAVKGSIFCLSLPLSTDMQ